MRPTVQIPDFSDDFPIDAMLADREKSRLDAEWEAAGGVNVDLSAEGLAQAAEGGKALGQGKKITPPQESTSEQVRDRASQIAGQGPVRKGLDTVLKTLTGSDLATLEKSVNEGTLGEKVSAKLLDPVGNIAESLLTQSAKDSGLDGETAAKVGAVGGIALGMLFPPGGKTGLKNLGAAGKAIAGNMYEAMFQKIAKGDLTEAGQPSVYLQVGKILKDAGLIKTADDLRAPLAEIEAVRSGGLKGKEYQDAIRDVIQKYTSGAAGAARKAPWAMTREELVAAARASKAEDKNVALEVFGASQAKEYERLQRAANSTLDTAKADAAATKIGEMESRLTPEQQNRLFGIGTEFVGADVYDDFRKAIDRVDGDTPQELGQSLRWAVTRLGEAKDPASMTTDQQIAYAQLKRGLEIADARGFDQKEVSEEALKAASQRFKDPEDALFMLRGLLKKPPEPPAPPVLFADVGGAVLGAGGAVKAGPRAMAGVTASRLEGTAPDVAAVIKNIGAFNSTRMEEGVVTHAETIAKATGLMTLDEALKLDVSKWDIGTLRTAVAGHYKAASEYLKDVATRVVDGDAAAEAEYWGAFAVASDLAAKDALLGTQQGRGLEAAKIALRELGGVADPRAVQEMAQTMAGGVEAGMDAATHARRMLALKPAQREETMRQTMTFWKAGQNAFLEAWINGLISGPQTHVANTMGSAVIAAWAPAERTLAATADAVLTGGGTWGDRSVYYGEVPQMMYGMVEGLKDGLRLLGKQLKEEGKALKGGAADFVADVGPGKMERPDAITAEAFGLDPSNVWGGTVDFIGGIVRGAGRGLMTEDAVIKAVNYRGELRALAYREAAQEGLTGKAFWGRVREIIAAPPPAVKEAADQFKLTQTLNRAFDDMGTLGAAGGAVGDAVEKIPMLRLIAPFVRTPTNSLHFASERVPILSLISDTIRADLAAGGAPRAQALAKITGGVGVAMVISSYAAAPINPDSPSPYMNMVTGEGPKDQRMRAQLTALGWQPYSIWNPVDGKYVSYKRSDPMSTIFGTVASFKEISGQLSEQGALESVWAMGIALQKAMLSKTFLTGLSDFLESMEGNPQDINRFFQGLARSGVPGIVKQTTRTLDPIKRDIDTLFDHWRAGMPGYDGPADHNIWGDEIMYEGGLGPDIVSPYYQTTPKDDPVSDWLVRNKVVISAAPKAVGSAAAGETPYIRVESDKPVKLTKDERQRLKVLVGKGGDAPQSYGDLGPLSGAPTLKDAIAGIIAGPGTDGPGGSKASMIQARVNGRKEEAIRQLRNESPELDRELTRRERASLNEKTEGPARPLQIAPGLVIPGAKP